MTTCAAAKMPPSPPLADPPFASPRPWCRSCALACWIKAGQGTCGASTKERRKPRWMELGHDKPTIFWAAPLDDCWRWEERKGAAR